MTMKIVPSWDEIDAGYVGTVRGLPELGAIKGGPLREDFEDAVSFFMENLTPPQTDFTIEWPGKTVDIHLEHLRAA